jgi:hypothetical protein
MNLPRNLPGDSKRPRIKRIHPIHGRFESIGRFKARGQVQMEQEALHEPSVRRPAFRRWGLPLAYSFPRVIHRSEESPQGLLPAASVNNSAARKNLALIFMKISPHRENTHHLATNSPAGHAMSSFSPSRQAMRWSLTNTQWRTALPSRSHYKPFARISQRVFRQP